MIKIFAAILFCTVSIVKSRHQHRDELSDPSVRRYSDDFLVCTDDCQMSYYDCIDETDHHLQCDQLAMECISKCESDYMP